MNENNHNNNSRPESAPDYVIGPSGERMTYEEWIDLMNSER